MSKRSKLPSAAPTRYSLGLRLAYKTAKQLGYQSLWDIIGGAPGSATLEIDIQYGTLTLKHLDGHCERILPKI